MLSFALLNAANAASPNIVASKLTILPYPAYAEYSVARFQVDFDQNIYMSNGTALYKLKEYFEKSSPYQSSVGVIKCFYNNSNYLLTDLYLAPPTTDPIASLYRKMSVYDLFYDLDRDEVWLDNRYAAGYRFPTPYRPDLEGAKCSISFNGTKNPNNFTLVNSNRETVAATFNFTYSPPQCNYTELSRLNSLDHFKTLLAKVSNAVGNSDLYFYGIEALKDLKAYYFLSREAFVGCEAYAKSLYTLKNASVNVPASIACPFKLGNLDYAIDPCCNSTLAVNVCCVPKAKTVNITKLNLADTSSCRNPQKIVSVISDVVTLNLMSNNFVDYFRLQNEFEFSTYHISYCLSAISGPCMNDGDCPFSGEGSCRMGTCTVDPDGMTLPVTKCILQYMDPEMRLNLKKKLGVPSKFSSSEMEAAAIANAIVQKTSEIGCSGLDAVQYSGSTSAEWSNSGLLQIFQIPPSQTECTSEKRCSYQDGTARNTNVTCNRGGTQTGFCGICQNGSCEQLTEWPSCTASYDSGLNNATCLSMGGAWEFDYKCTFKNRTTENLCLTGISCNPNSQGPYRCSSNFCYIPKNITLNCPSGFTLDSQFGFCISYVGYNACLSGTNYGQKYSFGVNFYPGKYDTQNSCTGTTCSLPDVRSANGTPQTCATTNTCTARCLKCENGISPECRLPLSSSVCNTTANAVWTNGYCKSFASNSPACTSVNGIWTDCGALNANTCKTSSFSDRCFLNPIALCSTEQECVNSGRCTDYEYGVYSDGRCVFENLDGTCGNGQGMLTKDGKCLSFWYSSEDSCKQQKGIWRTKARSQAECLAIKKCEMPGSGGIKSYNSSYCQQCGGKSTQVYDWIPGQWVGGKQVPLTWKPIELKTVRTWGPTVNYKKQLDILYGVAMEMKITTELNRDLNQRIRLLNLYKIIACDCTPGSNTNCFGKDTLTSPKRSCILDSTVSSSCDSDVSFPLGSFPENIIPEVNTSIISVANFINSNPPLQKRAFGNSAQYSVVKIGGQTVGQIVGPGTGFSISSLPLKNFTICLDINFSIDQDLQSFPTLDIGLSVDNSIIPQRLIITQIDQKYCATVEPFQNAIFYPILRISQLPGNMPSPPASITMASKTVDSASLTRVFASPTPPPLLPPVQPLTTPESSTTTATATAIVVPSSGSGLFPILWLIFCFGMF